MQPASASSPISVSVRALEPDRQRTDRMDVRLVERARAVLQHLDETGLVERRIGVGRAGEAGHAAGDRRAHFRFERRLVFEARLAQARRRDRSARERRRARVASIVRLACQSAGASPIAATLPAATKSDATRSTPFAGSITRPLLISIFTRRRSAAAAYVIAPVVSCPRSCSSPPCAPRCRTSPAAGSPSGRRPRPPNRSRRRGSSDPDA